MEIFNIFAASCTGKSFYGFPTWYSYLPSTTDPVTGLCTPQLTNINDIWLIVAAVINILLRLAAIIAVIMVIVGGVKITASRGNPQEIAKARETLIYSVVGLVIAISASLLITFVAHSLGA